MMARCAPRLIRPLLNGLNMGKVQSFQYLRVAEHSQVPASPQPERSFSSTHRLHDVPRDTGIPAQGQTPEAVWRLQGSANPSVSSVDRMTVHFINRDGERLTATAKEGESLLEVVVNQNLGIDGFGACEGTLACSTCHLIFEEDVFQKLDTITDEELDMLDLAYGLTDTSRLGCQVCVKKAMDGLTVQVPVEVADMRRELEVEKQSK